LDARRPRLRYGVRTRSALITGVAKRVHCAPVTATLDFAFRDCVRPAYGARRIGCQPSCYPLPVSTTAQVAFFGQP